LVLAASTLVVFHAGRRLAGDGAGLFAGAGCALFLSPAVHGFWDRAQIESFLTLLYGAVFLLLAPAPREGTGAGRALGAGLIAGGCYLLKQNAIAFPFLAIGAVAAIELRNRDARGVALRSAAFVAGFAMPPAAMIAWLASAGGLRPFLEHSSSVN